MEPTLISFRYSKGKGRRYFEKLFGVILAKFSFGLSRQSERVGRLFTPKLVREGKEEIFSSPELRNLLRREERSSLSPAKMKFLTGIVRCRIQEYEHPERDVRVVIESAATNCIPVLGAFVWLKKRNHGVGGFFEVRGNDLELRRHLAADVRKALGRKLAD